jgi:iron-regulated transporter 1
MHNRLKMSLNSIGLISFTYQVSFLFVCLASIFLPGSPFSLADRLFSTNVNYCSNNTLNSTGSYFDSNGTRLELSKFESFFFESPCTKYTSIVALLSAMAISRFGLWLTDLVIHQMIQQSVPKEKRGIIGGVQNSMNKIFDVVKYVCVIMLSDVRQYGWLLIISVSAVTFSYLLYIAYVTISAIERKYDKVNLDEMRENTGQELTKVERQDPATVET